MYGFCELPDEHLEAMDLYAGAEDEEHIGPQREIMLNNWADEVRMWMFFAIKHNVGAKLSNPERALPLLLASCCSPGVMWISWLPASHSVCKSRFFVPRQGAPAVKAT